MSESGQENDESVHRELRARERFAPDSASALGRPEGVPVQRRWVMPVLLAAAAAALVIASAVLFRPGAGDAPAGPPPVSVPVSELLKVPAESPASTFGPSAEANSAGASEGVSTSGQSEDPATSTPSEAAPSDPDVAASYPRVICEDGSCYRHPDDPPLPIPEGGLTEEEVKFLMTTVGDLSDQLAGDGIRLEAWGGDSGGRTEPLHFNVMYTSTLTPEEVRARLLELVEPFWVARDPELTLDSVLTVKYGAVESLPLVGTVPAPTSR